MRHGSGHGSWLKLLIRRVEHLKCALQTGRQADRQTMVASEKERWERDGEQDRQMDSGT